MTICDKCGAKFGVERTEIKITRFGNAIHPRTNTESRDYCEPCHKTVSMAIHKVLEINV